MIWGVEAVRRNALSKRDALLDDLVRALDLREQERNATEFTAITPRGHHLRIKVGAGNRVRSRTGFIASLAPSGRYEGLDRTAESVSIVRTADRVGNFRTGGADRAIGDPEFDAAHTVLGKRMHIALVLTPDARSLITRLLRDDKVQVIDGLVTWEREHTDVDSKKAEHAIREMQELVSALTLPKQSTSKLEARLAENLALETHPDHAAFVAEMLFTHCAKTETARRAALETLDHRSPRVRLFAHIMRADGGPKFLHYIKADAINERVLAAALERAPQLVPIEVVVAASVDALKLSDSESYAAACAILAERADRSALATLRASRKRMIALKADGNAEQAARAIAAIIERCGDPESDGGLALVDNTNPGELSITQDAGELSVMDSEA